ncbi:hypothetical protein EW093_11045 [Thiospirochaeta perfilievii]|uniref:Lipoprotein n=1 Tax=Thiospirochaeta perfilievii TaxID=252967 RepID=A0A5C1QEV8_9SPIO|nr:hypothetical protein [Thiospirochaeta perfilievii]QEN05224.1 hypothetical protein EW093_11045 [Thiospirochaeta perfilievii]
MVKFYRRYVIALFSLLLLSCEVSFNRDLREYVNNVVDRTPLKFSVSGSSVIDDYDAINMGFLIDNETSTYTVVNNEKSDINLTSFPGINGDFIIPSFETFILKKGESFNLDIGFVASANTFNKRVSSQVKFFDKDGRAYTFYLWATSRNQPISLYDIDLYPIEECDLGAWGI